MITQLYFFSANVRGGPRLLDSLSNLCLSFDFEIIEQMQTKEENEERKKKT